MDYKTTITGLGEMVPEFVQQGIVIVYNDNCPPELKELSVTHTAATLDSEVRVGDVVVLGDRDYVVTAVGEEVNETLRKMGHCTLSFDGAEKADLPGYLVLQGEGIPELKAGDPFEILFT